jgi:murein DD-endopeptidase MepM/ murein hydrolase activator NlpD
MAALLSMPIPLRRYPHVVCVVIVAGALAAMLLSHSRARAASVGELQQQISAGQGQIQNLSGAVSAASSRLAQLNSNISSLEGQISRIQSRLDVRERELAATHKQLHAAHVRLGQLVDFEGRAERVLSAQLVSSYEGDNPDLVTVVLESTGFQNLLESVSFAERIRKQDVQIIGQVRTARRAVAAQAVRLGKLEVRDQTLADEVRAQRNELTSTKINLDNQQIAVARDRDAKSSQLSDVRGRVSNLQRQLSGLEAAQAAAAARAAAASSAQGSGVASSGGSSSAPPPAPAGNGGFVFPLPKSAASPPGSWSPDDGVDISAPGDTPEYAVCSGTIVLHGIGGFGPWAPVLHCDGSLDGYDYVYYGHAGPANQLPVGTHVSAGEVMSSVGPGIVGISTGPHLEIGFADSSGSPVGPSSAGTMLSLLQSAY